MPADEESEYSNEEGDASMIAVQAQQRILQLKKDRDERMRAVLGESNEALESLRCRVTAFQDERCQNKAQNQAACVQKVIDAVERRRDIERRMDQLVKDTHSTVKEVELIMVAGCRGRERSLKQLHEEKGT